MLYSDKKILIIRLGAIGDVIRTLPALNALRKRYPHNHIAWIVEENSESILAGHPQLDEVIIVHRKRWEANIFNALTFFQTIKEILSFIKQLREKKFDVVLDFHGLFKSGILSFLSGADKRIGFKRKFTKEFNFLFNNYHVLLPEKRINRVKRNLFLLHQMGIYSNIKKAIFPLSDDDKTAINIFFKQNLNLNHNPIIVIHAGSSKNTWYKRWETVKYAQLADMLITEFDAQVIFTWAGSEIETVKKIAGMMKKNPIIACPTNSLRELTELIKRCDLYIGGDTAPMHIAAFSNIPVLAIFGPTDPIINAPFGNNISFVIRKDLPCSPCRNRKCKKLDCIKEISCEEVFQTAKKMIQNLSIKKYAL